MRKKGLTTLAGFLLAALLVVPAPASAVVIVDPDAFANGTDISAAFAGVTLIALGQANPAVFSLTSGLASTGTRVFGNTDDAFEWGDGFNGGMRVNFAAPVSFVSIDIIGNDGFDNGRLIAFNIFDTVLATYTTGNLTSGLFENASIFRPAGDIAYVVATGSANGIESVSLDNLQYEAVPEPGTLLLLGSGLTGLVLRRRRRLG